MVPVFHLQQDQAPSAQTPIVVKKAAERFSELNICIFGHPGLSA
jgi:hypothetical protein